MKKKSLLIERKNMLDKNRLNADIEVDGGINAETAKLVKKADANALVAGSYIYKADNIKQAVQSLR